MQPVFSDRNSPHVYVIRTTAFGGESRSPFAQSEVEWVELGLTTGEGIKDAVAGVDIIVHTASDARRDPEADDVRGTERLLDASADADGRNFVYVSIVGIDEIPYSYYQHKLAAERGRTTNKKWVQLVRPSLPNASEKPCWVNSSSNVASDSYVSYTALAHCRTCGESVSAKA